MTWWTVLLVLCVLVPLILVRDKPKPEAQDYARLMAEEERRVLLMPIRVKVVKCEGEGRTHLRIKSKARR